MILAFLISLTALAETPSDYVGRFQDEALLHAGARYPLSINIRLGLPQKEKRKGSDARCVKTEKRACRMPVIEIDIVAWLQADDLYRELLVFHEMGHCILNLGHEDNGIMHPDGPGSNDYLIDRERFHQKLFSNLKEIVKGVKRELSNLDRNSHRDLAGNGLALK